MQKDECRIKEESDKNFLDSKIITLKYRTMQIGLSGVSAGFSRSKIVGVPAVLVFGIGLIMVGQIGAGLAAIGVAVFFLLIVLSEDVGWKALWFSLAAFVFGCVFVVQAVMGVIKGQTTYTKFRKGAPMELVTRIDSPEKFRAATNARWALAGVGLLGAAGGFTFYRASTKDD